MSLINEALKKAQRLRHEGAAAASAPLEAGGPIAKRAQPKSARSTLLIVAGAAVLVVLSMVGTTWWLTRPVSTTSAKVAETPKPAEAATVEPLPAISAGVSAPPTAPEVTPAAVAPAPVVESATPAPAPVTRVVKPTPVPGQKTLASSTPKAVAPKPTPTERPTPAPVAATPAPAEVASVPSTEPPAPPKPDERIHQFVEALKVTGIRSSGTDSKVLMNDRVFRVNDVVDRSLGVRLTKVSSDSLTFTDANGAVYVKYF
jgi:cytoskeletal protein RodZ